MYVTVKQMLLLKHQQRHMFDELTGERLANTCNGFAGRKTVFGKTRRVIGAEDNMQGRTITKVTAL